MERFCFGIKKQDEIKTNFEHLEDIWDKYDVYEKHNDDEEMVLK